MAFPFSDTFDFGEGVAAPLRTSNADALIAELMRRKQEEEARRQMEARSPLLQQLMQGNDRQEDLNAQMLENLAGARRRNAEPPAPVDTASAAWDGIQARARGGQSPIGQALASVPSMGGGTPSPFAGMSPGQRDAASFGLDANGQRYRQIGPMGGLTQGPASLPQGPPSKKKEIGDGEGGLTVMRPADKSSRTYDVALGEGAGKQSSYLKPGSDAFDARRQGNLALKQKQANENQQSALLNALMASDPRIATAVIGAQADKYGADKEFEGQQAGQAATADLAQLSLIRTMMESGDPGLMAEARRMLQSQLGGGQASVPSGPSPPAWNDITTRIAQGRGLSGADPAAPPSRNEVLDQFNPAQLGGLTPEGVMDYGLTEESLLDWIGQLENEAQRETAFGRVMSGLAPGGMFGIGTRDPQEVAAAARRLQIANAMLNALRRGGAGG